MLHLSEEQLFVAKNTKCPSRNVVVSDYPILAKNHCVLTYFVFVPNTNNHYHHYRFEMNSDSLKKTLLSLRKCYLLKWNPFVQGM